MHFVLSADSTTFVSSQQSWKNIFSDGAVTINPQNSNSTHTMYVSNSMTLSTQHKSFSHHTSDPHYNLHCMDTQQLAWYFAVHGYTEGEILSNPMLYMNAAYLTLVKQFPRYPAFVEKYHKKYRAYSRAFKIWETMHLRYCKGLAKQFERLYLECENKRCAQEVHEQKQRELKAQEAYIRELGRVENILNDSSLHKKIPINDHNARLEKMKIAQQQPGRTVHQLQTGQDAIDFVAPYGITEQQVTRVTMNSYEYQLHTEFISHIHSALGFKREYNIQDQNVFIDALGNGLSLGMKSNHLHNPEWATRWSDFCYEAIEIIQGVGEGIVLGSYNAVDMVMHPVRTLVRMADGIRMLGSLTARTVGMLAHWNYLIERGEYLQCATEMYSVGEQLVSIANTIHEQTSQMSHREIAKQVTAFGAECVLTGQMFTMGHSVCSNLSHTIKRTIKFLKDEGAAGEFALATTDGILLKASENINTGGSGFNRLIQNSNTVLETVHAKYIATIEAELESLRLRCDNKVLDTAHFGNKYLKPQYKHILGMELGFSRQGIPQIDGFHHDFMQVIEKSGAFRFTDKVVYESGFYSARLYHGENFVKHITFFLQIGQENK